MLAIDEYGQLVDNEIPMLLAGPIVPPQGDQSARSSEWPKFVKAFLSRNPSCRGCGRRAVTGHHVKPFHLFPELELVESNLVAVCLPCHFVLCHGGDWKLWIKEAVKSLSRQLRLLKGAK